SGCPDGARLAPRTPMKRKANAVLVIALAATGCSGAVDNPGPAPEPQDLQTLNQELSTTTLPDAVERSEHFRPLCDDEGYPLVGNLNGKVVTTASEFCQALRDDDLL